MIGRWCQSKTFRAAIHCGMINGLYIQAVPFHQQVACPSTGDRVPDQDRYDVGHRWHNRQTSFQQGCLQGCRTVLVLIPQVLRSPDNLNAFAGGGGHAGGQGGGEMNPLPKDRTKSTRAADPAM